MVRRVIDFPISGFLLKLRIDPQVFAPTLTSRIMAKHIESITGRAVLDLGCGVGPLAIVAAKSGASIVYAVDIMEEACACARHNADMNGVGDKVRVLCGDLFEPVNGMKFDMIIDDASGMSEQISRISPWYPQPIPSGGLDGTDVTIRVLEDAASHLHSGGRLYFPVLGLSKARKTMDKAYGLYGDTVRLIEEKAIPFCRELYDHMDELKSLKAQGLVDYTTRRSRSLWNLKIFSVQMV